MAMEIGVAVEIGVGLGFEFTGLVVGGFFWVSTGVGGR